MAEYISNFIAGFEGVVPQNILHELGGAEILRVSSGFVHFRYAGKPEFVASLPFINNSFSVIASFGGGRGSGMGSGGGGGGSNGKDSGRGRKHGGSANHPGDAGRPGGRPLQVVHGGVGVAPLGDPADVRYRAGLTFDKMVQVAARKSFRLIGNGKSFRVRFSNENRFEKVPNRVLELAESAILENCDIKINRLRPDCEFWFIIRRDGVGFFGQLLKKTVIEKQSIRSYRDLERKTGGSLEQRQAGKLNDGELRPELACLLCIDSKIDKSTVVCDPFAGYGAIPLYIHNYCQYAKMYVNDIDAGLVKRLRKTELGSDTRAIITCSDTTEELSHIGDASVDLIVTDPPWGLVGKYGDIAEFYRRALTVLKRVLKVGGNMVLLTGMPEQMAAAAKWSKMDVISRVNILVNGKKACVFTLKKMK